VLDAVISHVCRVVQIGKALQDQQWLFESLMVQVDERRSAVENNAKQIEDRLVKSHHHRPKSEQLLPQMLNNLPV